MKFGAVGIEHQAPPENEKHQGIQTLAWIALVLSLIVFLASVVLAPRGIEAVLSLVQEPRGSQAKVLEGTVLYQPPAGPTWQQLAAMSELSQGTRLRTDDRSRVLVTLPDGSTLLLFNDTELALQTMQFGRFNQQSQDSVIRLFTGKVRIGVSQHPFMPGRQIAILVDDVRLDLGAGSHLVERIGDGTGHLAVRAGQATIWSGDRSIHLSTQTRAEFGTAGGSLGPLPIERDLVQDPLFASEGNDSPWQVFVDTEAGIQGQVEITDGVLRFVRRSDGATVDRHGESGVTQDLNIDARDFITLQLRLEVRTDHQSLSGGGTAGTEYPLMVRLIYLDNEGSEQIWGRGFYYQNDAGLSVKLGQQVPSGQWISHEVKDLLATLQPPPVQFRRIEVLGSGWEYDSSIRRIEMTGH